MAVRNHNILFKNQKSLAINNRIQVHSNLKEPMEAAFIKILILLQKKNSFLLIKILKM
jgi:hypothetical protein